MHCHQGVKSVNDYANEFQRLSARNNLNEEGSFEVLRFVAGLCEPIRDKFNTTALLTLERARALSVIVS